MLSIFNIICYNKMIYFSSFSFIDHLFEFSDGVVLIFCFAGMNDTFLK